jgi:tRNA1(Val) A37 N6-methylase TrmN6
MSIEINNYLKNQLQLNQNQLNQNFANTQLNLSKNEIKQYAAYFTPNSIVINTLNKLDLIFNDIKPKTILEPSCGDGAFLNVLIQKYNESLITAYEIYDKIYNHLIQKLNLFNYNNNENLKIINQDYLSTSIDEKYDLIVGNPPYFITKNKMYNEYYKGRPNIFIQFIIHSLLKLNDNGVLCFIIPETFLNCSYYSLTRNFIKHNFKIIDVYKNPDDFKLTNYSTITFIVQKILNSELQNQKWFYNDIIYYSQDMIELLNKQHTTLSQLGAIVKNGNYVWNEHRNEFSDSNNLPVLIYLPNNIERRNYILTQDEKYIIHQDTIIINRGYGNSKYNFNIEYLSSNDYPNGFILENHIIFIQHSNIEMLKYIYKLLTNKNTIKFINTYTTNGAINVNSLLNDICLFDE